MGQHHIPICLPGLPIDVSISILKPLVLTLAQGSDEPEDQLDFLVFGERFLLEKALEYGRILDHAVKLAFGLFALLWAVDLNPFAHSTLGSGSTPRLFGASRDG